MFLGNANAEESRADLKSSAVGAEAKEEKEERLKTPPSSPILPQAVSSPSQAEAAAEILQSFCSTSR